MDDSYNSYSRKQLDDLFLKMISYYGGDPKRIQHFIKVHSFSRIIAVGEQMDESSLFILEAAAYTHDIGIKPAEEKYGQCNGKLQEQEGPIVAQKMLSELGFENYLIDRICYLIGHHHTYTNVDGLDYQVLIEADFLVNLYEDGAGALLDDVANLPQKIIDATSLTRLTDEVGNLFEGNNPDYKLPNFVSSGIKYAKESFNSLVKVGNDAVTEVKRKAGSSINRILGK